MEYIYNRFIGNFNNARDVVDNFKRKEILNYEIIVAAYFKESYEGAAYLLLKKGVNYYEVEASHCSCNGLEECFRLGSPVDLNYIRHRLENGEFFSSYYIDKQIKDSLRGYFKLNEISFEQQLH